MLQPIHDAPFTYTIGIAFQRYPWPRFLGEKENQSERTVQRDVHGEHSPPRRDEFGQEGTVSDDTASATGVESRLPFERRFAWQEGAIAGLVATVAMGVAITLMDLETLRLSIAGLYGQEGSLVIGWIAHLIHGSIFGILFAAILTEPGAYRVTNSIWKTIVAGLVYGLVLVVVAAGIVMPIWLGVVGLADGVSIPAVTGSSLVWHLVYGAVLGAVFPILERG